MHSNDPLLSPVQYIKGVGPKISQVLGKSGIHSVEDALFFVPRDYEDRRKIALIKEIEPEAWVTLLAQVVDFREARRGRNRSFQAIIRDASGQLRLSWFRSFPGLEKEFVLQEWYFFYGQVKSYGPFLSISHPEFEKAEFTEDKKPKPSANFGRIIPVYIETGGLKQKTLRKIQREAIKLALPALTDPLPNKVLTQNNFLDLRTSIIDIHFPKEENAEHRKKCLDRLIFEEFFVLELGLSIKKMAFQKKKAEKIIVSDEMFQTFLQRLPFQLTGDQQKALLSVRKDLESGHPMSRLLQGDVGSGKTAVALAAAYLCAQSGFQTAFMAPTEILAGQHYQLAKNWLEPLGVSVGLVTHSSKESDAQVICGTHALFQKKIDFKNLGLVIVDEQHRFGVEQRAELTRKNKDWQPHVLMMTATPIPRTLALTLYGDLDLSLIKEKPKNRVPIETKVIKDKARDKAYELIRDTILRGEQVYMIYPLVEQSEKLDLKSATQMFEHLQKEIFPKFKLALLHGRMKGEQKNKILVDFKNKAYDLLISTTVIEVGIDVPNATLMVIEHPERLGLSQLHQLRGRVGRGALKSTCILLAKDFVTERLRVLVQSDDGFEIAEADLKIRGPGEFLGIRQSGLPGFKLGNLIQDVDLLEKAKELAADILGKDPDLTMAEHAGIKLRVEKRWKTQWERLGS